MLNNNTFVKNNSLSFLFMKRLLLILIFGAVIFFPSCGLLNQAGEYERFVNGRFSLLEVEVLEIGGVEISELNDASGLNAGDMITLVGRMFSGELPSKLRARVEVENTTGERAAISGLEWRLLMKSKEYANGTVDKEVVVEPHSKKEFLLKADVDFLAVLQSESLPQILNVVFNMDDREEIEKLGIELKIKPYYKSGEGIKAYPGFITIRP
jgi:hypothetical protein